MNRHWPAPFWNSFGALLAFLALLLLAVGLVLVDYAAALALLAGLVVAWPALLLLRRLRASSEEDAPWQPGPLADRAPPAPMRGPLIGPGYLLMLVITVLIIVAGFALLPLLLFTGESNLEAPSGSGIVVTEESGETFPLDPSISTSPIKEYRASITPADSTLSSFVLNETVLIAHTTEELIELPERQVRGQKRGLLLQEVLFNPLDSDPDGWVSLTLPDGRGLEGYLCQLDCPVARVELLDFPKNAFNAARDAEELKMLPYVDTMTVGWSARNLSRGIAFAYVPTPYHSLRPLLAPFIGISSLGQLLFVGVGLLFSAIILPVLQPLLTEWLEDQLKGWMGRRRQERSSEGEEKFAGTPDERTR